MSSVKKVIKVLFFKLYLFDFAEKILFTNIAKGEKMGQKFNFYLKSLTVTLPTKYTYLSSQPYKPSPIESVCYYVFLIFIIVVKIQYYYPNKNY